MDYTVAVALAAFALVAVGAVRRSRVFGVFALVVLGLPTYVGLALVPHVGAFALAISGLQLAACVHFGLLLARPRMRPVWFRALVSIPGLAFVAVGMLGLPWAIAASVGLTPIGAWIPFALAAVGTIQSLTARRQTVDLVLDNANPVDGLRRHRSPPPPDGVHPLRIVQITDPHLGPYMSVARLRGICQRAVDRDPDLILITGDIMTMESHDLETVAAALEPLKAARGKVFACHGNHDLEARAVVAAAYARHEIRLLIDEGVSVGSVDIIGADFVWRGRTDHLRRLFERYPRRDGRTRLLLLHDPGAFRSVPAGQVDLVLAGHTHGGQVGLVSLGLPYTFLSLFPGLPDHGLWASGKDRLYVHRAHGHYGFPIRLGVPAEESELRIYPAAS